ncbi:hypothetical protein ASPWEDRAFT_745431 [Aspergillus wentii DTO 134E9]|uniref:Polymerase nucleotidyl transferase domain-containing protein n=1 Tax=Aspergillus wentii DTO 134E9 TaxID=1073089 RepID=A0A1L9RAN2_ASPWE|nr:uncharacterized protein ASPWEDRAFT_745431 [Aspergillus wentii DTO 134E9]KAI9934555.1 hypothetical protein MW887_000170 [Aspergillus wentii]OJJ31970.1 hypothetical protein ASPWEDRAFT_745431 [Aspergillus wentii DTO 134E9]
MVHPTQLATAAKELFHRLQAIPEFQSIRLVIIGGLAACRYNPDRETTDIDILVDLAPGFDPRLSELPSGATELIKRGLSVSYPGEFFQPAEDFKFRWAEDISVDFIPCDVAPYVPQSAMTIAETRETGELPFISALDLAIFKIHSYGLRWIPKNRESDAIDAAALVQYVSRGQVIRLSAEQRGRACWS